MKDTGSGDIGNELLVRRPRPGKTSEMILHATFFIEFIMCCTVYLVLLAMDYRLIFLKPVPAMLIALDIVFFRYREIKFYVLKSCAAFLFFAVGDVLLAENKVMTDAFGVVAFATGHSFLSWSALKMKKKYGYFQVMFGAAVESLFYICVLYATIMTCESFWTASLLKLVSPLYMVFPIFTFNAFRAVETENGGAMHASIGTLIFVASDTLIFLKDFCDFPESHVLYDVMEMTVYYVSLWFIWRGVWCIIEDVKHPEILTPSCPFCRKEIRTL